MPVGDERTMVTVDPGIRARAADVAALTPVAIAANLDQLDLRAERVALLPHLRRRRRARVLARKLPPRNVGARALFLNAQDALRAHRRRHAPRRPPRRSRDWVADRRDHARRATARWRWPAGARVEAAGLRCRPRGRHHRRPRPPVRRLRLGRPARRRGRRAVSWAQLYSQLAMGVPTATGGAVTRGAAARGRRQARARPARSPCARLRPAATARTPRDGGGFPRRRAARRGASPARRRWRRCARRRSAAASSSRRTRRAWSGSPSPAGCEIDAPLHAPARLGERRRPRAAGGGRGRAARGRLRRGDAVDRGAQRAPAPVLRGGRLAAGRRGSERVWNGAPLRELRVPKRL